MAQQIFDYTCKLIDFTPDKHTIFTTSQFSAMLEELERTMGLRVESMIEDLADPNRIGGLVDKLTETHKKLLGVEEIDETLFFSDSRVR